MKLDQIYQKWISSIDLTKTRIVRFPSLIFLCGGPISQENNKFYSCRDIFYHYIIGSDFRFKDKIVLAENIFQFFEHSKYNNLLNFESDLAELSVLTIIFSESPGSIAEFGSFAVLKSVQEKLLIVMHRDDADKNTFIWRGPALYLRDLANKNGKENPITIYEWRKKINEKDIMTQNDFSIDDAEDLKEIIENILLKIKKTVTFQKDNLGHILLLMLDILSVVRLATLDEITSLLNLLGINHSKGTVGKHLSLLPSLKLADKKNYGNNVYYFTLSDKSWLSLAFQKNAMVRDLDRWKNEFTVYYSQKDLHKHRALYSYMISKGLIGN